MTKVDEAQNAPTSLSYEEAIGVCEKKYSQEYHTKKWFTLAVATAGVALLIIPAIAVTLAALSVCSFGFAALIATPIVIPIALLILKIINDKTQYWNGNLALQIIKQKEDEDKDKKTARSAPPTPIKA